MVMHLIVGLLVLLLCSQVHTQTDAEIDAAARDVQRYLDRPIARQSSNENAALENSNKIGIGYNPVLGSPVCYTGECQMEGFARAIFKLNYSKRATGSCTNKMIPEHVDIDCLASMASTANTEVIDTVEKLHQGTLDGIEISASLSSYFASFSYVYSKQTRSMIDTMVRENSTILFTSAKVSCFKLSSFAPMMELSDGFRYVIKRLPCCSYNDRIQRYISEYLFNYFGYTYVKDILLGGVVQQRITINEEERSNLVKNDVSTSHSMLAQLGLFSFSGSLGANLSTNVNEEKLKVFRRYSKQSSITALGGDTSITSIEQWAKTVPSNPVIIKFGISSIFDLINDDQFPDDENITKKLALIETALDKYLDRPVFCYKNCTRGICKPSGYFQFGTCECDAGYAGFDCSSQSSMKLVPAGTLCGFKLPSRGEIPCGNQSVSNVNQPQCAPGYVAQNNFITSFGNGDRQFMGSCFKTTESSQYSPIGTLCGFSTNSPRSPINILCGGRHPYSHACPRGYERQMIGAWATCVKMIAEQDDLPGTLCGMHAHMEYNYQFLYYSSYRCNGYDVENGHCPEGYRLGSGLSLFAEVASIGDLRVLNFCVKS